MGNGGDDSLNGGLGFDVLTGGSGQDTFQIQPGKGNVVIMDFTDGEDKILITAPITVTTRIIGSDTELLSDGDLMAKVLNSSGLLQQDDFTFS
jgi:Ca2+-binding RTX toxin-like protein